MSEGEESLGSAPDEAPESRADTEAARVTRQGAQPDGDGAEETESGTTDEVIDIEVCEEKTTAQTSTTAAEAGVRHIPGSSSALKEPHSPGSQTTAIPRLPVEVGTEMEKTGTKRPASMASLRDEDAHPAPQGNLSALKRDGPSGEGGYPCGRPSASSPC